MKVHLAFTFLISLLLTGAVYAAGQQPVIKSFIEDDLILIGEFSDVGSRSAIVDLPMYAGTKDGVLYIEFTEAVGDVNIDIKDVNGKVYSSSINVSTAGQIITVSIKDYNPGSYMLEFSNSKKGYVYGNFAVE